MTFLQKSFSLRSNNDPKDLQKSFSSICNNESRDVNTERISMRSGIPCVWNNGPHDILGGNPFSDLYEQPHNLCTIIISKLKWQTNTYVVLTEFYKFCRKKRCCIKIMDWRCIALNMNHVNQVEILYWWFIYISPIPPLSMFRCIAGFL